MSLRWYQKEAVDALINADSNGVVVLPTGSGKSHVLRGYAAKTDEHILILSHVKEILSQNFNKLAGLPDIGLWSAGLDIKIRDRITVAGIQSVFRKPELFREFDKVLIDEAHLVSNEGMYKTFLTELGVPYMGLTATDFRLKGGYIHGPQGMFDKVIYEAPVDKLTEEGWLCPLVYYGDREPLDTEGVSLTGGDFNLGEMSFKFNREAVTIRIAEQIARYNNYKHVLIFCIDIEHAENVAAALNQFGMPTAAVHSKSPRDEAIQKFTNGEIQALTNVNILTTGFDFPAIDMIALLRPTKSMGLHQQMLGRGMRTDPGKTKTLIKDFTSNTSYLGTVAEPAPLIEKSLRGKGGQNPFLKECPECCLIVHPSVRVCECGHKFQFRHNLKLAAHIETKLPQWYQVDKVFYSIHHKRGSPNSLKVTYRCGTKVFTQYVLIDHPGWSGHKARHWVKKRYRGTPPTNLANLYKNKENLKKPNRIQVEEEGRYPRIISVV